MSDDVARTIGEMVLAWVNNPRGTQCIFHVLALDGILYRVRVDRDPEVIQLSAKDTP